MLKPVLIQLYQRDLNHLKQEIKQYKNEANLWKTEPNIKNSGGNLCLHILGNLNTYIGNGLANIGYVRQREYEFSATFVERDKLYTEIDQTIEIVQLGLTQISDKQFLSEPFPIIVWEAETSMAFTLIHLHGHLNYHLGQINYHRRLLDK